MKLLSKFILFFSALFVLLATVALVYFDSSVRSSFKEQALNYIRIIAGENEAAYFAFLGQLKTLAINWSSDNYIKELTEKMVDETLSPSARDKAARDFGYYLRDKKMLYSKTVFVVDILNKNGIVIASNQEDRVGVNEGEDEVEYQSHYFSKTINANFGDAFSRSAGGEKEKGHESLFHVTTRMFSTKLDREGKFIPLPAVLLIHFNVSPALADLMQGTNVTLVKEALTAKGFLKSFDTAESYLVNEDYRPLTSVHNRQPLDDSFRIYIKPTEECFLNKKEFTGEYINHYGTPVLGASMCLTNDGLVLIKEVSAVEAYALYDDLRKKSIVVGGSIFLIILIATFLTFRKPLSHITLVARAAEQIARGNFTVHAPEKSNDEVGALAHAFNVMATRLRSLYNSLELKVATRTRQIEIERAKDEALLESIGDGIIATNEKGEVIKVNRAAEKMFKWDEKELLGKVFPKMIPAFTEGGKEIPLKDRPVFTVLRKSTSASLVALFARKDGTRFPVSAIVNPVLLNNKLIGTVAAIRDITKEKEIEKMRLDLLSLASHQLRTPLSGTKWLIETLRKGIHGTLGKEQGEYIEEIYKINERMTGLVSDMLSALRIESGMESFKTETVSVPALFETLAATTTATAQAKHIALHFNPDGAPMLSTAPKLLENILENFIANAIIYSPEHTEVFVGIQNEPDFVTFSVKDSGIGIPQNEQAGIFSRFYRATNARTVNTRGNGLGLYITSMLAEKIGAKVYFVSEVGSGSTFYARVPKELKSE